MGPFEEIREKPSNRYLSGILFPVGEELTPDEDDSISQTQGADDESGNEGSEGVSLFRAFRPSTAGVSFAINEDGSDRVVVSVRYALYQRIASEDVNGKKEEKHQQDPQPGLTTDPEPEVTNGSKRQPKYLWKRVPFSEKVELNFDKAGGTTELSNGLSCIYRIRIARGVKLVTIQFVNKNDGSEKVGGTEKEAHTFFQFRAFIHPNSPTRFLPRPPLFDGRDEDEKVSALIYSNVKEYAVGHTCSAVWRNRPSHSPSVIVLTWMPTSRVRRMDEKGDEIFQIELDRCNGNLHPLAFALEDKSRVIQSLRAVISAYEKWIANQSLEVANIDAALKDQAVINLDACKMAAERMEKGIKLLESDAEAYRAFQFANRAMFAQAAWNGNFDNALNYGLQDLGLFDFQWRPFQIGFVLLSLESTLNPNSDERKIFDLIWFPTGGGKTEAYLLLAAILLFYRRLKYGIPGCGVATFMRYTLRTLTVQQFQRAAALLTACELIRGDKAELLTEIPFGVGLWVGSGSTPNKFEDAVATLKDEYAESSPKQLIECPVCHGPLNWFANEEDSKICCECISEHCQAAQLTCLPVHTVDSDILKIDLDKGIAPPSLVIGTIDKYAQIVRNPLTGVLFGRDPLNANSIFRAPELIIQDELHLISGPLGTLAGIYEIAIDYLCASDSKLPKIVGSTATIRRAATQIKSVFNRLAKQFPPPALDARNSCFAKQDDKDDGRLYLGITTAGRSEKFSLQSVAASLLQSGAFTSGHGLEPYLTLVAYFNSLKTLGGAMVLMEDDVRATIGAIADSRSETSRSHLSTPEELTSRKKSSEIPQILNRLKSTSGQHDFIDVLLASNMLSVGVDIPRLGLMLVNGQPKNMAEYIQATSRVGRKDPGLVVTLYNNLKIRDKAHFEAFASWHRALYRSVEPGSVTPFAPRARDKAVHAPLIALARHFFNLPVTGGQSPLIQDVTKILEGRIAEIDPQELSASQNQISEFCAEWAARCAAGALKCYWDDYRFKTSLLMSAEAAAARRAAGAFEVLAIATPNSLRNVEPSVSYYIRESSRQFDPTSNTSQQG